MKIKRSFKRKSGFRDAKLFVIATEGQETEYKYFIDFRETYRNPKIHIEPLKRQTSASSPKHILEELNKFRREYNFQKADEFWLVIDTDRWKKDMLGETICECGQKNYYYAISNPRFELWLLLHLTDINDNNKRNIESKGDYLEKEIRNILGSYNKSNINSSKFLPHVNEAISRAKKLDTNPGARWPNTIGSTVYKLVEKLI